MKMNNIQKLIKEIQLASENAKADANWNRDSGFHNTASFCFGASMAFSDCVQKLTLLLKDESKQPQPPDFANTMLGEVPHEVNAQSEECSQAVEGATPVVRQNEQTKEDGGQYLGIIEPPAAI